MLRATSLTVMVNGRLRQSLSQSAKRGRHPSSACGNPKSQRLLSLQWNGCGPINLQGGRLARVRYAPESRRRATWSACPFRGQQRTFVSSCISDPAAHARPDEAAPPMTDDLLLASSCQRQRTSQNLVFKPRRSHDPNRSLLRSNRLGPPI
jgi:hypothetical protein